MSEGNEGWASEAANRAGGMVGGGLLVINVQQDSKLFKLFRT